MKKRAKKASWELLNEQLTQMPEGAIAVVPRAALTHPRNAGARTTATWPVGQIADYAFDTGPAPLAVRQFDDRFEAFVDTARLATQVIDAVETDPKKALYVGAALAGGALGSSLSNKREGVLLGAGLGLLFAALLDNND